MGKPLQAQLIVSHCRWLKAKQLPWFSSSVDRSYFFGCYCYPWTLRHPKTNRIVPLLLKSVMNLYRCYYSFSFPIWTSHQPRSVHLYLPIIYYQSTKNWLPIPTWSLDAEQSIISTTFVLNSSRIAQVFAYKQDRMLCDGTFGRRSEQNPCHAQKTYYV